MKRTFRQFRLIAKIEGISYLVLLFFAMPLKYFANMPLAVTIVGGIHGFLFVLFCILLFMVFVKHKMGFGWAVKAFISSIIPFGTFYMDKYWKQEEEMRGQ